MKASDLRIGNWVSSKCTEGYQEETVSCGAYMDMINTKDMYTVKPIPLTEEWLIKLGFIEKGLTKKENKIYFYQGEESIMELEKITTFFLMDNSCYGTQILYVHQLQNLYFALTGEELTIK